MDNENNQLADLEEKLDSCDIPGHYRKCQYCREYEDPAKMYVAKNGRYAYHRECRNVKMRKTLRNVEVLSKEERPGHEGGGEDVPATFKAIGWGVRPVAWGIKKLGTTAKSEAIRLRAHELAAKCLNMIPRDNAPIGPIGIQVVFNCSKEQASPEKTSIIFGLAPIKE